MSVAPEIAILAGASPLIPARPARAGTPGQAGARPTLGTLARHLRLLAATPERWWGLVRFDPDRSVRIQIEDRPEYRAWLVVLPPAPVGQQSAGQQSAGQQSAGQDCDCDVATVIAGEATDGGPGSAVLRPGSTRVHGPRHRLRGHGAGYSISLHARAVRPVSGTTGSANPPSALSQSSARMSSARNVEVLGLMGRGGTSGICRQRGLIGMIEVRGLSKRYGEKLAVNNLSFDVLPGKVTGFLGPNGAGKTTTMRLMLGLDYPNSGTVTIDGKQYVGMAYPMREVGALLDAKAVHGGRSAYNHLLCLAQTNNLPKRRVAEVLELVGLTEVARKRTKGFSLGMSQRLGIAATMLGDPKILMFDEPVNGLDPEGILWIRNFMKTLAAEGRTIFVSSHLMSEMENTADHLIVIGRGQLLADCTMDEFIARSSGQTVRVATPQPDLLVKAVAEAGGSAVDGADGTLIVSGLVAAQVGDIAFTRGVRLHELTVVRASLEAAFMELTADSVEYRGAENEQDQPPAPAHSGQAQSGQAQQPAQEQLVAQGQQGSEGGI
jgi:ABC-2 type transport system ATP-binding protein